MENKISIACPQLLIAQAIEANSLQRWRLSESKNRQVERLQYTIGEEFCAIIDKESRKYLLK